MYAINFAKIVGKLDQNIVIMLWYKLPISKYVLKMNPQFCLFIRLLFDFSQTFLISK